MSPLEHFPPARHEALRRIADIRPADYARTRNALDGAVTRLSPYLTHGLVDMREVLQGVASAHRLHAQHKLVFELGWRAYFRHVWQHRGKGILRSIHPGPLPDPAYATELPADIRQGRTGVPVIDQAVRELYATGWLHNHARMWLASYVVHVRKVHWRAGADWLYGHLLDGDLASNHLSWQWVAGTGSHKPYLFNAENVAKFAPAPWHSPGTVIDTTYEALDQIARDPNAHRTPSTGLLSTESAEEPALLPTPPDDLAWTPPRCAGRGRPRRLACAPLGAGRTAGRPATRDRGDWHRRGGFPPGLALDCAPLALCAAAHDRALFVALAGPRPVLGPGAPRRQARAHGGRPARVPLAFEMGRVPGTRQAVSRGAPAPRFVHAMVEGGEPGRDLRRRPAGELRGWGKVASLKAACQGKSWRSRQASDFRSSSFQAGWPKDQAGARRMYLARPLPAMNSIPPLFAAAWHQAGWLLAIGPSSACLLLWLRLREANFRLSDAQRIIASSNDAIVTKALDGRITSWNGGAERIFGYQAREMIGQPITRLFPPDAVDEEARLIAEVSQGRDVPTFEAVRLRRDGRPVHLSISLSPLRDEKGLVIGATKIAQDISDRHALQQTRLAQEQAERTAAIRGEFLANMSHELRTPLNGVLGFTQLLQSTPLTEGQREQLGMVEQSARHLLKLLDDILQTTRLERGALHIEPEPFDLHETLRALAVSHEQLCDAQGLSMTLSLDPDLPRWVRGDAFRLRQALGHLLGNAVKFTPHGGIRLSARPGDGGVWIEVDDTGIGMSEAFLPHLFEPFSQADSSATRHYGGSGLGTNISKQLVDMMQGRIEVQSALGQGTTVRVWLPLPEVEAGALRRRMLVADTQADYLDLLRLLLGLNDQDIVHVTDGSQALSLASDGQWSLVLASDSLPGLRGAELATRVRQTDRERATAPTPLVALTRSGKDARAWREAGANAVIEGPVKLQALLPALADLGWTLGQARVA
jgi:deoxyribodipyrimidine photo-lyase